MTREECENKIIEKLKEIRDIHSEYNPNANYLSMFMINKRDGYINVVNNYKDTDRTYAINKSVWTEREEN